MTGTRPAHAAILLFLISVAVCIAFTAAFPLPPVECYASEYLSLAQNVPAGEGFIRDGEPSSYRPPLFSGLLAGWFRLTGTSSVYSAAVFQSPHEHGWKYVDLVLLFHIPFYLFLLRSVQWLRGTVPATIGFMLLL